MKILYAIQGTGNGHLSRAIEILPALQKHGQVDVLISGTQSDLDIGHQIHYKLQGVSFIFGKNGGINIYKTIKKNSFIKFIRELIAVPINKYDLVINDFEPVTAWACLFRKVPCVAVSHQAALTSAKVPKPKHKDWFGKLILKFYAPGYKKYGFHFKEYDHRIYKPIIRKSIRRAVVMKKAHYTVYLPAFSDVKIINFLMKFPEVQWQVFSKHTDKCYCIANVSVQKIDKEKFIHSLASSSGVICGAGFETPSEALFLGKKLLVIPMKSQYEQHFNAMALSQMMVPVVKGLKKRDQLKVQQWIASERRISVDYPDQTEELIDQLISDFQKESRHLSAYDNQTFQLQKEYAS